MKVETHNHPTAISPYPGAATGSGGEIRDEGATGRGAQAQGGPDRLLGLEPAPARRRCSPWEHDHGKPDRIASALDIMLEGPLGGAAFNNEFGRPNLCRLLPHLRAGGAERAGRRPRGPRLSQADHGRGRPRQRPRASTCKKGEIPAGAPIVVLGGPAMLIGLGGGAASSLASGASHEDLDFASVQRDNAEMQRRCQEVIDRCWALGDGQPHRVDPRRRRRRAVERAARAGPRQRPRRALRRCARSRTTSPACRRWRSGATRRRSATCWRSPAERLPALRGAVRARALPVRGPRPGHRRRAAGGRRRALRRPPHRPAARRAARQAAADDPRRRTASRPGGVPFSTARDRRRARRCAACCACRPSPTRRSWSRSAIARSAGWWCAIRWSARGRCRSPTRP